MKLNERIENYREELINDTINLCKIKSVEEKAEPGMPFGAGVARALEEALAISKKLGFKTANIDGYCGYAEYGEGEDYVAVLGHLDVVPEGEGWDYPPYAGEIHDGKIYARGAIDDKGPLLSALYGLKALVDSKASLSKRVRVIFGTNEETGSKDIRYYLTKEKPPIAGFTPDGEYPIIYAEKGLTIFDLVKDLNSNTNGNIKVKYIKGGDAANVVPNYCETAIEVNEKDEILEKLSNIINEQNYNMKLEQEENLIIIKSYGKSAHGSLPETGVNAIMPVFNVLNQINIDHCELKDIIEFFDKYVGEETDGTKLGIGLRDEVSGKLTFNVGVAHITENKLKLSLNLRYPVTFKYEDMMAPFEEKLKGIQLRIEKMDHQAPLYFPKDHFLIKTLQKVYEDETGKKAELLAIGGGTYAKEMPNVVAFGPLFPGEPDVMHQPNEYMDIEELILNTKIYAKAIYELAK